MMSEYRSLAESEASEKAWDFRRAGGKKPRVLRGIRRISTGSVIVGIRTQDSCLKEVVSWDEVRDNDKDKGSEEVLTSKGAGREIVAFLFPVAVVSWSELSRSKAS